MGESEVADSAKVKIKSEPLIEWCSSPMPGSGSAGLMILAGGQAARRRGTYWN